MNKYSSRLAAKKLGIDQSTLAKYITAGKIPAPETVSVGERVVHAWTDADIEQVRKLLPKISNGRKTRYQKKESVVRTQKSGKTTTKTKRKKAN